MAVTERPAATQVRSCPASRPVACADARSERAGEASGAMSLIPLHRLEPPRAPCAPLLPDSYLTDGRTLFRVVSKFTAGAEDASASLEDCLTLEVQAYAPGELHRMRLRRVQTAE